MLRLLTSTANPLSLIHSLRYISKNRQAEAAKMLYVDVMAYTCKEVPICPRQQASFLVARTGSQSLLFALGTFFQQPMPHTIRLHIYVREA
jgi:hypothetical protein